MAATIKLTVQAGQNPLAFFAALGLLRVLDDHALAKGLPSPRLAFVNDGRVTPVLSGFGGTFNDISGIILEDAARCATDPVLSRAYNEDGDRPPDTAGATLNLKPSDAVAKGLLDEAATCSRRTADLGAAFFSELVQDKMATPSPPLCQCRVRQSLLKRKCRWAENGPDTLAKTSPAPDFHSSVLLSRRSAYACWIALLARALVKT